MAAIAVLAGALGLAGCGGASPPRSRAPSADRLRTQLAGSPSALARLHADANRVLGGGKAAFEARLAGLRGHPVVINDWGSWCTPCRAEFPLFQRASARFGRRVAFLGLDVQDVASSARSFLRKYPVSYPSYEDPSEAIARSLGPLSGVPTTVFITRAGKVFYTHTGFYASQAVLDADIRRYALHSS